ncbi:DUF3300 domain-containing protein [Oxalobacteraceae bacterium OTU3CINTB1]|nr:DUF3300 domain-containing protein [Oxalobacteraceae bacterium OTU3CINTB1]
MGTPSKNMRTVVSSALLLSLLAVAGCNKPSDPVQPKTADTPAAAQAAPYTPPTADQLSQMVAPIALFPDKLVGQVLAGATYPEQISAANQWLAQNPSLKGDALQSAEAGQPWDVSVKALTTFPSVLNQMAGNLQWTTALGEAYVNDPNDVMNAIQAMRLRAQQAGNLKSSPHLRVSTTARAAPPPNYVEQSPVEPLVYSGPAVIPPPPQTIVIEPAEPDVVYVPRYDPAVVYGAPVPVYRSYRQPAYSGENLVATGVISFGVGVLVGAAASHHHDWGWNAWDVNWGAPRHYDGGWQRPAVVYNNATYISKSVTVVNHVNNINVVNNNYRTTNNVVNRTQNVAIHNAPQPPAGIPGAARFQPNYAPLGTSLAAHPPAQRPVGAMTVPHFNAHDTVPGTRPSFGSPAMSLQERGGGMHMPLVRHAESSTTPTPHAEAPMPPVHHAEAPMRAFQHPETAPVLRAEVPVRPVEHAEAPMRPVQHAEAPMRPVQHAEAFLPRGTPSNHDVNDFERAHANGARQEMLAMHNERPHASPPAPVKHVAAKHEDNHHHDKHDGQERHG